MKYRINTLKNDTYVVSVRVFRLFWMPVRYCFWLSEAYDYVESKKIKR